MANSTKNTSTLKSILAASCTGAALLLSMNAQAADPQGNAALVAKIDLLEAQLNALRQEIPA